jgi:hypothetical protein
MPGRTCFLEVDGTVYRTYAVYARGFVSTGGSYYFLELTALGRQEGWEQPAGRTASARGNRPDSAPVRPSRLPCAHGADSDATRPLPRTATVRRRRRPPTPLGLADRANRYRQLPMARSIWSGTITFGHIEISPHPPRDRRPLSTARCGESSSSASTPAPAKVGTVRRGSRR